VPIPEIDEFSRYNQYDREMLGQIKPPLEKLKKDVENLKKMRHQEQEQREEIEKAKAWKEHLIEGKFLFGMGYYVGLT
jgi:septal ring factor EnvC (AmiA/AmiB activator)